MRGDQIHLCKQNSKLRAGFRLQAASPAPKTVTRLFRVRVLLSEMGIRLMHASDLPMQSTEWSLSLFLAASLL